MTNTVTIVKSATIIIPTLNEASSIADIIHRIFTFCPDNHNYSVIVVDDGSIDGTDKIVNSLKDTYPVKLLQRGKRLGLSSAVREGAAIAETEFVLIMDADGSHPPEKIPELLSELFSGHSDLVIGSRYIPGGKISGWPLKRALLSRGGTLLSSLVVPFYDPLSGFFACSRKTLLKGSETAKGYKILLELLANQPSDFKVSELPIHFIDRVGGASKMTFSINLQFFTQLLRLIGNKLQTIIDKTFLTKFLILLIVDTIFTSLFHYLAGVSFRLSQTYSFLLFSVLLFSILLSSKKYNHLFDRNCFISFSIYLLVISYAFGIRVALPNLLLKTSLFNVSIAEFIGIFGADIILILSFFLIPLLRKNNERGTFNILLILQGYIILLALFLFKLLYLPLIDLMPQEALHWCRAMNIAPAFVDHPGGVALLIRTTTALFGTNEFAVRLGAFCCGILATIFVYGSAYRLSKDRITALLAAVLFNMTPMFWGIGFFVYPDSLLIAGWAATAFFFLKGIEDDYWYDWCLVGLSAGLAFFSKYTVFFIFPSIGLYFILLKDGRRKLFTLRPLLIIITFFITILPLLIFEYHHGWQTFYFQFFRRMKHGYWALPNYFLVIMAELTPILAVLIIIILILRTINWFKLKNSEVWLLLAAFPMLLFYLVFSNWNRVKFSWPAPAFITLFPILAAYLTAKNAKWRKTWIVSFGTLIVFLALIHAILPLSLTVDFSPFPAFNQIREAITWKGIDIPLNKIYNQLSKKSVEKPFIIALDKYHIAAEISFYSKIARSEITSRNAVGEFGLTWQEWTNLEAFKGKNSILLAKEFKKITEIDFNKYFSSISPVKTFTFSNGYQKEKYYYRIGYDYKIKKKDSTL